MGYLPQFHDRTFTELFFDLGQGGLEGLALGAVALPESGQVRFQETGAGQDGGDDVLV